MPLKKYSPKKRTFKKRIYKRKSIASGKRTKSLVALINKISLRKSETKNTHAINENTQLNHNSPLVDIYHLNTTQSVGDNNTGTSDIACRVGDEVVARGLSYKFWFANKLDRPNVMYKIVFFKFKSGSTLSSTDPYYSQGTANYMIRDIDTEKFKIVKVVKFNLENNAQRVIGTTFNGAEGHRAVSVWLPMRNKKIKYENGSGIPMFEDYGFSVVAYDSFGTLTTDNIASFAYNRKFYFKDP